MSEHQSLFPDLDCTNAFNKAAVEPAPRKNRARPFPVSIRVTADEKARLERDAGKMAVGNYIRHRLFDDEAQPRPKRYRAKQRKAAPDTAMVAKMLGTLGQSDMTKALFALLVAAERGDAHLPPEHLDRLNHACDKIDDMREMLIVALNMKAEAAQ